MTKESNDPSTASDSDEFVSLTEAARRLKLDRHTLAASVKAGEVPALRVGRVYRLHWPTVMAIMRGGTTPESRAVTSDERGESR